MINQMCRHTYKIPSTCFAKMTQVSQVVIIFYCQTSSYLSNRFTTMQPLKVQRPTLPHSGDVLATKRFFLKLHFIFKCFLDCSLLLSQLRLFYIHSFNCALTSMLDSQMAWLGFFLPPKPRPEIKLASIQLHLFLGVPDTLAENIILRKLLSTNVFFNGTHWPKHIHRNYWSKI